MKVTITFILLISLISPIILIAPNDIEEIAFDGEYFSKLFVEKEPKYFKTWIIRILYNNCTDITRSSNGKIISFEEKILDSIPDDDAYLDITNNCDFFELIDSLTDDEKTLITLKFSKDYDNKDIGKILNIKEGSVRMRFLRIKEKLKSKYKGEAKNE